MKINQFGYVPTSHQQIINELTEIHFLNPTNLKISDPMELYRDFLLEYFSQHASLTTRLEKIHNLMATETIDAATFTKVTGPVSAKAFYNIGLQLLGFLDGLDFSLKDPFKAITQLGLPKPLNQSTLNRDQLIDAWYRLLNTRNKYGQLLIDYIAGKGYYQQFLNDSDFKIPLFFNGKAQAVFNTDKLIREVVYVESSLDSDHDGKRDLLKTNIIRPAETNEGYQAPVIFTADPYAQGMNEKWSEKFSHDNNRPLKRKQPNHLTYQDVEARPSNVTPPKPRKINGQTTKTGETFTKFWSYSLNVYFLARGFAVVYSSGIGTKDSDGFRTTGTKAETLSATAVIEWLNGNRTAFTNRSNQIAIDAWWTSGNVGMTGRSYLGTLATAAAFTGVDGLKTSIVEAGLSDYYPYYRENGLVAAPDGDDADVLAEWTFSRQQTAGDYAQIKDAWLKHLKQMTHDQEHDTGSFNQFWDARNVTKYNHTKADMLLVHGLNDWNVKTGQVWNSRNKLKTRDITQKLILHQGQHEYLNNFRSFDYTDLVNLWLSNKLFGIQNRVDDVMPDVIVQNNAHAETWDDYPDWGGSESTKRTYSLANLNNINGNLSFSDQLPNQVFEHYTQHLNDWRNDLYSRQGTAMDNHCIRLLSDPLKHDITIDGQPTISLVAQTSSIVGQISVALVDYGEAQRLTEVPQTLVSQKILQGYHWRKDDLKEFLPQTDPTDFKRITEAHINMQNRQNSYRVDNVQPQTGYKLRFGFQPTFWHLLKGHQLGLVIYASDLVYTVHGNQAITYTLNLNDSTLEVPVLKS